MLVRPFGLTKGYAMGSMPEVLTVQEVAERLRVSNMTIYRLIKAGELPAIQVGKSFRIRPAALESYLSAHSTGGET